MAFLCTVHSLGLGLLGIFLNSVTHQALMSEENDEKDFRCCSFLFSFLFFFLC